MRFGIYSYIIVYSMHGHTKLHITYAVIVSVPNVNAYCSVQFSSVQASNRPSELRAFWVLLVPGGRDVRRTAWNSWDTRNSQDHSDINLRSGNSTSVKQRVSWTSTWRINSPAYKISFELPNAISAWRGSAENDEHKNTGREIAGQKLQC